MKKWLMLLMCLCLLPCWAMAEEETLPEGYRLEDFGDFTMPMAPNSFAVHYDKDTEDGYVADIIYVDVLSKHFAPYITVWWHPNNMTELLKGVHPLDYAKALRDQLADGWRDNGMVVTSPTAVYGQKKGDVMTSMVSCRIEENSWYAEGAHDLWYVQRIYGNYTIGTYYFEIIAESRADADAVIKDLDRIVYRK